MARRRVAERREILPDPIFNSQLVTKFINGMMWEGKKPVAESIFYGAMDKIAEKTGEEPLKVFKKGSRTSLRRSRSNRDVSAVPPTRCPSK